MRYTIKSTLLCFLLVLTSLELRAQKHTDQREAEIKALKISVLSTGIGLSPEEAKAFWPIYNEYEAEKADLLNERRREIRAASVMKDDISDKEAEATVLDNFNSKQRELDMDRKYFERFKKILPVKKTARIYVAEGQFKRELLKRIRSVDNE